MSKQQEINNSLRFFEYTSTRHKNCVRINTHNSLEHEIGKLKVAYKFIKKGKTIITEAKFKDNKGIADIVVLDDRLIIEILHSETEEKFKNKIKKYPDYFNIIPIKV